MRDSRARSIAAGASSAETALSRKKTQMGAMPSSAADPGVETNRSRTIESSTTRRIMVVSILPTSVPDEEGPIRIFESDLPGAGPAELV